MKGAALAGATLATTWGGHAMAAEPVGEARLEMSDAEACSLKCAVFAAHTCYWARKACQVTAVITIGRSAFPCAIFEAAACVGAPLGMAVCQRGCR